MLDALCDLGDILTERGGSPTQVRGGKNGLDEGIRVRECFDDKFDVRNGEEAIEKAAKEDYGV